VIVGLPTAQPFHLRVMDDPEFRRGELDITYLERVGSRVLAAPPQDGLERAVAVTAALLADERRSASHPALTAQPPNRPTAWGDAGIREGCVSDVVTITGIAAGATALGDWRMGARCSCRVRRRGTASS